MAIEVFITDEQADAAFKSYNDGRINAASLLVAAEMQWQEKGIYMFVPGSINAEWLLQIAMGHLRVVRD